MRRTLARVSFAVALALGVAAAGACGTDAVGVDTCRQIESARCKRAPDCPDIHLDAKPHAGDGVDACIRFYDDACQHGLASGTDPGAIKLNACVAAINAGSCTVVEAPESDPACAWLIPPATPDAAADTSDADASDGSDGATE
jgi:hypothetical protein